VSAACFEIESIPDAIAIMFPGHNIILMILHPLARRCCNPWLQQSGKAGPRRFILLYHFDLVASFG